MSRLRRQSLLRNFLAGAPASSQEQLVAMLADAGQPVTQATVSRDLAAIGAVRAAEGYRLPVSAGGSGGVAVASPPGAGRLATVLREHVLSVEPAAALAVVRTAPGHANFVATELDADKPMGMVGCIAGDDTIFIATASEREASRLSCRLTDLMDA